MGSRVLNLVSRNLLPANAQVVFALSSVGVHSNLGARTLGVHVHFSRVTMVGLGVQCAHLHGVSFTALQTINLDAGDLILIKHEQVLVASLVLLEHVVSVSPLPPNLVAKVATNNFFELHANS